MIYVKRREQTTCYNVTEHQQFNSHKSVQKLFHNLHTIFSNSLMGFKVIVHFRTSEGTCQCSRNIFLNYFFGDRFTIEVSKHLYTLSDAIILEL